MQAISCFCCGLKLFKVCCEQDTILSSFICSNCFENQIFQRIDSHHFCLTCGLQTIQKSHFNYCSIFQKKRENDFSNLRNGKTAVYEPRKQLFGKVNIQNQQKSKFISNNSFFYQNTPNSLNHFTAKPFQIPLKQTIKNRQKQFLHGEQDSVYQNELWKEADKVLQNPIDYSDYLRKERTKNEGLWTLDEKPENMQRSRNGNGDSIKNQPKVIYFDAFSESSDSNYPNQYY